MNLEDYFPEDPFLPSLCYAAAQQLPVNLPWTSQRITLGTGFLLSDPASREPLRGSEAISSTYREQNLPIYHEDNSGTYVEAMSTTAGSAYDHVDLSIAASVGGSLLGASGRGTYETKTLACRDAVKASVRSTFLAGTITFASSPSLSAAALQTLRQSKSNTYSPEAAFRQRYGDYYVAALRLGGSNATMVSATGASSSESKDMVADVTAKIVFIEKAVHLEDHTARQTIQGTVTLTGFDSLDSWNGSEACSDSTSYTTLRPIAEKNLARAQSIEARSRQRMLVLAVQDQAEVAWETCIQLCERGVVAEILLLPFAGLREYVQAIRSTI